jgi:hypothetical protein
MHKKFSLLLTFLIVPLLIIKAQDVDRTGGYARFLSLGYNPYIVDPEFIKVNPAWASDYYNFVWGDLGEKTGAGTSAGQFAGLNFKLNDNLTLGGILSRNDMNPNSYIYAISLLDPLASSGESVIQYINSVVPNSVIALDNNIEAFTSFKLSNFTVGIGVAYASSNEDQKPAGAPESQGTASQLGINGGILTNLGNNMLLDAGLSLIFPSAEFDPGGGAKNYTASQTIIALNARLFYRYSEKIRFIPSLIYVNGSSSSSIAGVSGLLPSASLIGLGVGMEYTIGDLLLVGGPSFVSRSETIPSAQGLTPQLNNSISDFPIWNLGAEWKALNWLIVRGGYFVSTNNSTVQTPATPITVNETSGTYYGTHGVTIGIGLRFGGFSLDGYIDPDAVRQGLNLIGGQVPTFAYISASFAF